MRRWTVCKLVVVCMVALGALAVGAEGASAATYENLCPKLNSAFCTTALGGLAFGVAVDNSSNAETKGDVYEAELEGAVLRFTATGEPAAFTGTNGNISGNKLGGFGGRVVGVAVEAATGDFYVTDRATTPNTVEKFTPKGEPLPAESFTLPAEYSEATGLAVVSSGPSTGDIWVANGAAPHQIDKFSPTGNGKVELEIKNAEHPNNNAYTVAVDAHGVYVGNRTENVQQFSESGTWERTLNSNNPEAIAVDPLTEEVYVIDEGGATIQPYNSAGTAFTSFSAGLGGFSAGLGVGTNHFLYASNLSGPGVIFGFENKALEVTTGPAENITTKSATITGSVTPREAPEATGIEFEWGPKGEVSKNKAPANVTSTTTEVHVHAELTGLEPGKEYEYRLVATAGTEKIEGTSMPLDTLGLATVTAEPASEVKIESATLNGKIVVSPEVEEKGEYYFEYTPEGGSATKTSATPFTGKEVTVSVPVSSLEAGKKYDYQLVAVVEGHEIQGKPEAEFNTPALGTATTDPASEVKVESAKLNGTLTLNPEVSEGEYYFEYTPEGGSTTTTTPKTFTTSGQVSEAVALEAGKNYTYQLIAVIKAHTIPGGIEGFTTPPKVEPTTEAPSSIGSSTATFHGKIKTGAEASKYYFAYGEKGEGLKQRTPEGEVAENKEEAVSAPVTGLMANKEYEVELIAVTVGTHTEVKGGVETFTTLKAKPAITNTPPCGTCVTRHGATLAGEVNTEESPTEYWIEYGETEAYGNSGSPTERVKLPEAAGPTSIAPVSLNELKAGTVYHYRIVAENTAGIKYGPDATFETQAPRLPFVLKVGWQVTSPTTATLKAFVEADGLPTSYALEVGTEVAPGEIAYTPTYGEVGSSEEPVELTFPQTGLLPGTTYHWRVVLTNEDGKFIGADHTFATPGFPAVITPPALVTLVPFTMPNEVKPVPVVETRAQKYTKAVQLCQKIKSKKKRAACMKTAKKKYGPVEKKKHKKK